MKFVAFVDRPSDAFNEFSRSSGLSTIILKVLNFSQLKFKSSWSQQVVSWAKTSGGLHGLTRSSCQNLRHKEEVFRWWKEGQVLQNQVFPTYNTVSTAELVGWCFSSEKSVSDEVLIHIWVLIVIENYLNWPMLSPLYCFPISRPITVLGMCPVTVLAFQTHAITVTSYSVREKKVRQEKSATDLVHEERNELLDCL